MIGKSMKTWYDRTVDVVFGLILVFIILAIAIGAIQLSVSVWHLLKAQGITGNYIEIITDVLTLYVLVELSRSLVEYFNTHKLRFTFIIDASIVFILREVLISLFKHQLEPDMIYALATLILVLGGLRIGSDLSDSHAKKLASSKVEK